jgi:hypothetical protein
LPTGDLLHDIEGTTLHLAVKTADIFAHQGKHEHLYGPQHDDD